MVKYDAGILQAFADSLYAKARNIVITYAVMGLLVGGALGLVLRSTVHLTRDLAVFGSVLSWGPALLGCAWGIAHGRMKAFMLKLEAQRTLCQVQLETNTRSVQHSILPTAPGPKQPV
jgi:hypothetical protein